MLLISAILVAADQVLKLMTVEYLKPVGTKSVISGLLDLTYVENRGAAFGIFQNQRWLFVGITLIICAVIIIALFRYKGHEFFSYAASAMIVGGGVGNMIDRVLHGFVVDYIQISFFPAIFNFGDCCVTIGTLFLIIHVLFFTSNDKAEKVIRSK